MCDGASGQLVCLPFRLLVLMVVRGGVLLAVLLPLFGGRAAEEGRKGRKYLAEVYFWAAGHKWEEFSFSFFFSF